MSHLTRLRTLLAAAGICQLSWTATISQFCPPTWPLGNALMRVGGSLDVADGGVADGVADVVGRPGLFGVVES